MKVRNVKNKEFNAIRKEIGKMSIFAPTEIKLSENLKYRVYMYRGKFFGKKYIQNNEVIECIIAEDYLQPIE